MMFVRMTMVVAASLVIGACGDERDFPLLTPYGIGYSDGCDSGYAEAGVSYFDYENDGGLFGSSDYSDGWDRGYANCQAFWQAAAL